MPTTNDPGIDAGELDKRVTLLEPVLNEWEDEITDWTPVADIWASVRDNYGREAPVSARTVGLTDFAIRIRYRAGIDNRWRVGYRGRVFRIQTILNPLTRNETMQLLCTEVT